MCRRWLLLRWRREKICNNTTTKNRTQKRRETRPRKSKLSVLEPPLSVLSQLFSFFIHLPCDREIQKRSICISKTERKQTMKKRAPTLPPTIIDRGLSMIAMRVTFSRACARARKKKVILYARANARKNAREKVKRKWKKNAFFRYRYKIHENSLSQTFFSSSSFCSSFRFLNPQPKNKKKSDKKTHRTDIYFFSALLFYITL